MSFACITSTKKRLFLILLILISISTGFIFSEPNYKQKLEWKADSNVLEYKLEIQNKEGKIITSEIIKGNSYDLSLAPGSYKYKLVAYDMLGRESVTTNWISFDILKASQPEIKHQQNLEALKEDGSTLEVSVNVADVAAGTKAELINTQTGKKIEGTLVLAATAGAAESEVQNAVAARFKKVEEGQWKLLITNPSGLSSESEVFEVKDVIKEQKIIAAKEEAERKEKERIEAERLAKEKAEQEKLEAERLKREKEEAERKEKERIAFEKAEAERLEKERIAKEKAEAERLERERKQKEELARIQAEIERIQKERLETEQREREQRIAEEIEVQHKLEEARIEAERLVTEREEEERLAKEREEAERLAQEEEEEKKKNKVHKDWDRKFLLAGGAGLQFTLKDEEFFREYFNNNMNFLFNAKLDFLPIHNAKSRFGFEIGGKYIKFNDNNDFYDIMLHTVITQANLVYRHNLGSSKNCFQIKGGGGLVFLQKELEFYSYNTAGENKKVDGNIYAYPEADGGLSLLFMMGKTFTLELGADVDALFIKDAFTVFCMPYINLGFRF